MLFPYNKNLQFILAVNDKLYVSAVCNLMDLWVTRKFVEYFGKFCYTDYNLFPQITIRPHIIAPNITLLLSGGLTIIIFCD